MYRSRAEEHNATAGADNGDKNDNGASGDGDGVGDGVSDGVGDGVGVGVGEGTIVLVLDVIQVQAVKVFRHRYRQTFLMTWVVIFLTLACLSLSLTRFHPSICPALCPEAAQGTLLPVNHFD